MPAAHCASSSNIEPSNTKKTAPMRSRIALLGMPNTGKSTFFNRITGANARTGNWPGITVDLLSARIILQDRVAEVIDLPGIYDLHGYSEDEHVVQQFLISQSINLVVLVLNAVQIDRQIQLAMQLKQLGINMLLLLNMQDEAYQLGIRIDTQTLSQSLGMPVQLISAKQGRGVAAALNLIASHSKEVSPQPSSEQFTQLAPITLEASKQLLGKSVDIPVVASNTLTHRIDHILLHPVFGLPLFFIILFCTFQSVYLLGTPIQDSLDVLQGWIKIHALMPLLVHAPPIVASFLADGVWDGLATVATFVPIVIIFFWFVALLEDTGYFSRVAYLMDAFMAKLGLDGRSFVMVLMGFGCNVPAMMGTRIMRSKGARLLSMLIIPFSLCSARLQVFVFLIGLIFAPKYAGVALFSLYVMGVVSAVLTALIFKNKFISQEPFVLELPPYRLPTLRMLVLRSWFEVKNFLIRASKFITLGVVLVWALTHLPWGVPVASDSSLAGMIGNLFAPIFNPLGIDSKMTIALIFGFVAKEIVVGALAIIYGLHDAALGNQLAHSMDWVQAYSFMLFTLIYTPCLATLATLKAESKSNRFMWLSLLWSLALAWVFAFVFYQGARALGF